MTNPTTEPNIRERLARANMNGIAPGSVDHWDELDEEKRDWYRAGVDAILAELENPSDGMLIAGQPVWEKEGCYGGSWAKHHANVWQAMIRHILGGGK